MQKPEHPETVLGIVYDGYFVATCVSAVACERCSRSYLAEFQPMRPKELTDADPYPTLFRCGSLQAIVFVASVLFPAVVGQVITGQITGRITDASGAVVPGVRIIVSQTEIGVTRTVEANNEGYYTAAGLLPPAPTNS